MKVFALLSFLFFHANSYGFTFLLGKTYSFPKSQLAQGQKLTFTASKKLSSYLKKLGSSDFRLRENPLPSMSPEKWMRQPSYLFDFDELSFIPVKYAVIEKFKEDRPTPAQIRDYVFSVMKRKNASGELYPASFLLKLPEGNHLRHATFLVALLRLFGHPAFLGQGLLAKETFRQEKVDKVAYIHSWVYTYHQGQWVLLDPFKNFYKDQKPLYLPLYYIHQEDLNFKKAFYDLLALRPQKIK